jgi:hypothetical protein
MVWPKYGLDMPPSRFLIFNFDLECLKEVQTFKAFNAKIYLNTNGLVGGSVLMFPKLYSEFYKCGFAGYNKDEQKQIVDGDKALLLCNTGRAKFIHRMFSN